MRWRPGLSYFCFALLLTSTAAAQSLPEGSNTGPAGGRPQSTQIDFFTLMESAGSAFLGLFEQQKSEPTPDDPEWNSQQSPRDTVLTFVEAMNHVVQGRRGPLDRALKTLGDAELDDPEATAKKLLYVFDRLPEISPGTIPGPDRAKAANISRYELFPRGIDRAWAYKALGEAPEGSITLVKQDGEWVFEPDTLAGVDDLLKSLKPIPPRPRMQRRGDLFLSVVEPTFTKTGVMGWLWFVGAIAVGFFIAWLIYKAMGRVKRRRELGGDSYVLPLLTGVAIPAIILAVTLGVAIGSTRLNLHPVLSNLRWSIIEVALVIAGVWLLVSLLELACLGFRRSLFANDDPYARMASLFIRRTLRILAGIVLLLFIFQNVFKWNIAAMLGGFGILALALSLAAKDAVKNLFGAATIFANRPFINGDWVRFNNEIGTVEDVSLQVTRIRLLSGEIQSVPNMKFIDEPVENLSLRQYLRRVMDVAITYDTPAEKVDEAMDILRDVLSSEEVVKDGQCNLDEKPPRVFFDKFGSHYLNLRADYWYLMDPDAEGTGDVQRDTERGWLSYLDHATVVNRAVLKRFNEAGIEFAFPTQTIKLESESDG